MNGTLRFGSGALLAALVLGFVAPPNAFAYIEGDGKGKKPEADCLIGLDGYAPGDLSGYGKKQKDAIQCTDCDPACDLDGATEPNGSCTFRIGVRVNDTGDQSCTPAALKKVKVTAKTKGTKLLSKNGDFGTIPLDGSSASPGLVDFPVLTKKNGTKPGTGKMSMLAKKAEKPKLTDKDKFLYVCNPLPAGESCPLPTTTTTSTSTSTSSTTTTAPGCIPPGGSDPESVTFTTGIGTSACGPVGLGTPPTPPLAGQIDDENGDIISPLGLGCLYIGGGQAAVQAGATPDMAPTTFDVDLVCDLGETLMLKGSLGTGSTDCSVAPGPSRFCANGHPGTDGNGACQSDADCRPVCDMGMCTNGAPGFPAGTGMCAGAGQCGIGAEGDLTGMVDGLVCLETPNCFFGPPLPIFSGGTSTCVLNVFSQDGSGIANVTTGEMTTRVPLRSDVYFTGNSIEPCPVCDTGTCRGGGRDGMGCTPVGQLGTSQDCPPNGYDFLAPLNVALDPLTTETSTLPDDGSLSPDGFFCPEQVTEGFYGNRNVRRIVQQGARAAGLGSDPRDATISSAFCIPATGNLLIDASANLAGPGATSLGGTINLGFPAP